MILKSRSLGDKSVFYLLFPPIISNISVTSFYFIFLLIKRHFYHETVLDLKIYTIILLAEKNLIKLVCYLYLKIAICFLPCIQIV